MVVVAEAKMEKVGNSKKEKKRKGEKRGRNEKKSQRNWKGEKTSQKDGVIKTTMIFN